MYGIAAASILFLGLVNTPSNTQPTQANKYQQQAVQEEIVKQATTSKISTPAVESANTTIYENTTVAKDVQIKATPKATPSPTPQPTLSNNNYYTNSAGNKVHSPAYSNTAPAGASAKCGDGTYSFSQSRRGTCSHHGGVSSWL